MWEGLGGTKEKLQKMIAIADPITCAANLKDREECFRYYLKKVKVNGPTKAARIYAEPVDQYTSAPRKEEPKTLLGKFLRWLTT